MRVVVLIFLLAISCGVSAASVPLIYTYQGELKKDGMPMNGTVDLSFFIFATPSDTDPFGYFDSPDIPVNNGLFTAMLLLNPSLFRSGGVWWLEVQVRDGASQGAEPYETLLPRQPITSVPYATNANTVDGRSPEAINAFKQATFSGSLPPPPASAEIGSLSFQAPADGTIIYRARGTCKVPGGLDSANELTLALGTNASDAFNSPSYGQAAIGVPQAPQGQPAYYFKSGFFAERVQSAVSGVGTAAKLYAKQSENGVSAPSCSGTITAEFVPGPP